VQGFIATLPGVAETMAAAFSATAIVGIGFALFETGKKIYEWHEKRQEEAKKTSEELKKMASEITSTSDAFELSNSRIEDTIAKLEHKPAENAIKTALLEASDQADKLGEKLDKDLEKLSNIKVSSELTSLFGGGPGDTEKMAANAARRLQDIIDSYTPVLARVAESGDKANFNKVREEELNRIAVDSELNKNLATLANYLNVNQDLVGKHNAEFEKAANAYQILAGSVRALNQQQQEEIGKQTVSTLQAAEDAQDRDKDSLRQQIDLPNTSMFFTPVHDLVKGLAKDQADYAAYDAKLLADQAKDNAKNFIEWLETQQKSGVAGAFTTTLPSVALEVTSQLNPVVEGVRNALDELIKSFTDTTAIMHNLVMSSLTTINSSILKTLTDPYHRGAWKDAGRNIATGVARSGLEMAEGTLAKHIPGLGQLGKTPQNAMWIRDAGAAGKGAGALAGKAIGNMSGFMGGVLKTAMSVLPFLDSGGPISSGMPAIVGESGPELFIPSTSGRVVSNSAMAGLGGISQVIHVDARGAGDPAAVRFAVQRGILEAAPRIAAGSIAASRDLAARKPIMAR
jgi:hypothetical protein